ncbi:hypothetical protein WN71_005620 [Streptomyces mangrovisoli]|uniref:VanZ-like domain-containing protein n=1 Tax=Streptomyces mangrovisoli TaxID=1428628 RepID=A0A1J4P2Y9_9ACTN|nr:VanZ family protein [Streptomyces mangrovisoli]OIJ68936.1 hypothetical protein WN71_005620 [Streptomyces mangrovisoli]
MARAEVRPRTTFRLRSTKRDAESDAERDTKAAAKTGRAGRTGWTGRTGKAKKAPADTKGKAKKAPADTKGNTKGKGRGKAGGADDRRPLPLVARLAACLCAFVFMVAFAVVLARITLEPSPASVSIAHTNLHPGSTLKLYLDQPALRDAVKQVGGNILLGVPFGVLVPVVAPRARGLLRVVALTAIVMLLVEFAQGALVAGRAFDIDDVILNTAGALLGYLVLGRRLGRAVHARKPRRQRA